MISVLLRNILTAGLRDALFWRGTGHPDALITVSALRRRIQSIDNLIGESLCLGNSETFRRLQMARKRFAAVLLRLERRDLRGKLKLKPQK